MSFSCGVKTPTNSVTFILPHAQNVATGNNNGGSGENRGDSGFQPTAKRMGISSLFTTPNNIEELLIFSSSCCLSDNNDTYIHWQCLSHPASLRVALLHQVERGWG
jgi:hypothetical protein